MIDGRIAHLGLDALARARSHSDRVIADVATVVRDLVRSHDTGGRGVGWVAIGSAARREMTSESDLDLIMLVEGPPPSGEQLVSLRKLDQDIREGLRDWLNLDVSLGSDLTSMTFTDDLRHLGDIRVEENATFTKRILLLTESRLAFAPDEAFHAREVARAALLMPFDTAEASRGRHWLALANDIARYYRTFLLEYKQKIDAGTRPWAIRNVKLRHTRKLWYLSTALVLVRLAMESGSEPIRSSDVALRLDAAPFDRLAWALEPHPSLDWQGVGRCFDCYLRQIGDPQVRSELERLPYRDRAGSAAYRALKLNANELAQAMIAIVDALPADWRHNLLAHFLL